MFDYFTEDKGRKRDGWRRREERRKEEEEEGLNGKGERRSEGVKE